MSRNDLHSEENLQAMIKIAARIVVVFGDAYLPVFNRLQSELIRAKEAQDKRTSALELAKSYADF